MNENSKVNTACDCKTNDASPAGIPKAKAENNNENWPKHKVSAYRAIHRHGILGLAIKKDPNSATNKNRKPPMSSGGIDSTPQAIMTKLKPQIKIITKPIKVSFNDIQPLCFI